MANDEQKSAISVKLPIAKRHTVLQDISKQLAGYRIEDVCEYGSHSFKMTTLDQDEEMWADGIMQTNSAAQTVTTYRMSRVAASIKSIDGVHVDYLFEYPEDKDFDKERYSDKYGKRIWQMNQMLIWLGDQPSHITDYLAEFYSDLNKRRNNSLNELKNSSSETLGGESKATSSPVKEFSQVTQTL